jgi:hypothetical protein
MASPSLTAESSPAPPPGWREWGAPIPIAPAGAVSDSDIGLPARAAGYEGSPGSRAERRQVELVVTHPDQREGGGEEADRGESSAYEAG